MFYTLTYFTPWRQHSPLWCVSDTVPLCVSPHLIHRRLTPGSGVVWWPFRQPDSLIRCLTHWIRLLHSESIRAGFFCFVWIVDLQNTGHKDPSDCYTGQLTASEVMPKGHPYYWHVNSAQNQDREDSINDYNSLQQCHGTVHWSGLMDVCYIGYRSCKSVQKCNE